MLSKSVSYSRFKGEIGWKLRPERESKQQSTLWSTEKETSFVMQSFTTTVHPFF